MQDLKISNLFSKLEMPFIWLQMCYMKLMSSFNIEDKRNFIYPKITYLKYDESRVQVSRFEKSM